MHSTRKAMRPQILLCRPSPKLDESWGGYLIRLSYENRFKGLLSLAQLLSLTPSRLLTADPAEVLPKLGVACPSGAAAVRHTKTNTDLRVNLGRVGRSIRSRVCPGCLASDKEPFVRSAWDHPLGLACKTHSTLLKDACEACGSDVSFRRRRVTHCDCGADFRLQSADPVPPWHEMLQRVFAQALVVEPQAMFAPAELVAQQAARVVYWLASKPTLPSGRRGSHLRDLDCFVTAEAAHKVGALLFDWPKRIAVSVTPEIDCTKWKGYETLNRRLLVLTFPRMSDVIDHLKGMTRLNGKAWKSANEASFIEAPRGSFGIKHLMRATGHSYGALLKCIESGEIQGATIVRGSNTKQKDFSIPEATYQGIKRAFRDTDDVQRASEMVGCSEDAIGGLVRSGCLTAYSLLPTGFSFRLCPIQMGKFARYLFQRATVSASTPAREKVYFSAWVPGPYSVRTASRWRHLLDAIRAGTLQLFSAHECPSALNDLYLLHSDMEALADARPRAA